MVPKNLTPLAGLTLWPQPHSPTLTRGATFRCRDAPLIGCASRNILNQHWSASSNFRALKPYLGAIDLFDAAFDRSCGDVEPHGHVDAMDVHRCVVTTLGKHVDEHRQRQRIFEKWVLCVDERDARDRMAQHDRHHFLFDESDELRD